MAGRKRKHANGRPARGETESSELGSEARNCKLYRYFAELVTSIETIDRDRFNVAIDENVADRRAAIATLEAIDQFLSLSGWLLRPDGFTPSVLSILGRRIGYRLSAIYAFLEAQTEKPGAGESA
jgi:hypothetical protein